MTGGALALALGAAVLHAGWNVLLAGSRDSVAATGALLLFGTLLLAPVALLTGGVSDSAAPYIAASAVLELVYFVLLARAYRGGELGVVYPVARGSAPVVVLVLGVVGLGRGVSVLAAVGVVLVAAGVSSCPRAKLGDFLSQAVKKSTSSQPGRPFRPCHRPGDRRLHLGRQRGRRARRAAGLPVPHYRSLRGRVLRGARWSPGAARS